MEKIGEKCRIAIADVLTTVSDSPEIAIEDVPEEEIDKMIKEVEKPVKKSKTKKG